IRLHFEHRGLWNLRLAARGRIGTAVDLDVGLLRWSHLVGRRETSRVFERLGGWRIAMAGGYGWQDSPVAFWRGRLKYNRFQQRRSACLRTRLEDNRYLASGPQFT